MRYRLSLRAPARHKERAGLPVPQGQPVFIFIFPAHPRKACCGGYGHCRVRNIEKSRLRSARPIRRLIGRGFLSCVLQKDAGRTPKTFPLSKLLHNKHYVNFSQCSAPYAPFARRSRPCAPLAVCLTCSGYSPAKSMRGFRSLRAQPSDFIFTRLSSAPCRAGSAQGTRRHSVYFIFSS
jgi:hypothetical protein